MILKARTLLLRSIIKLKAMDNEETAFTTVLHWSWLYAQKHRIYFRFWCWLRSFESKIVSENAENWSLIDISNAMIDFRSQLLEWYTFQSAITSLQSPICRAVSQWIHLTLLWRSTRQRFARPNDFCNCCFAFIEQEKIISISSLFDVSFLCFA